VRQLEVVAVSDDGTYVLLAAAEDAVRATHAVRIDARLQAAIRGELDDSERRESELSPKEIQARLRAGETSEQVAKAAKVPVARVLRYAGPVISERERIVDQARVAVLQRARGPELSKPLGEMVEKRLAATVGLRPETVEWTARRRDDGAWVVDLSYTAKGGARTASWLWQPAERELSSINGLATRLGAEDAPAPARRKRAAAAAPKSTTRATTARGTAKRAAAKPTVAKATTKAAAKPAAKPAKKAAAKPAAAVAKKAPSPRKPRRKPRVFEPTVIAPTNGRVEVPSWSDVLLGVTTPAPAPTASGGRRRS
jgi:hypothetical protein